MSLRAMKRAFERKTRKKDMADLYKTLNSSITTVEQQIRTDVMNQKMTADAHDMGMCMYYLFGLTLHDMYGFGRGRLVKLFEEVDRRLGSWHDGSMTMESLREELSRVAGIDVEFK